MYIQRGGIHVPRFDVTLCKEIVFILGAVTKLKEGSACRVLIN